MYISAHKFTDGPVKVELDEDGIWIRPGGDITICLEIDEARTLVDRINALLDAQEQNVEVA